MRKDAQENRERILAAAETVFGRQGAAGSTEELARLAGVGVATVFRHFPTKEALVEAALLRHFAGLLERARAADGPDAGAALRALIREMVETGSTKLTLATMLDPDATPDVVAASADLKAAVQRILASAQAAGSVRPGVGVDELYLLIRGLSQVTATTGPTADVVDRAIDLVLAGLTP